MLPFSGLTLPKGFARLAALTHGATYTATEPTGTDVRVMLAFKTDGTWEVTFDPGDTPTGTPLSATWLPSGGLVADYEVKFTVTVSPASYGVVTNGASSYSALSTNRSIDLYGGGAGPDTDTITFTVDLRRINDTTDAVSDSVVFTITTS